MERFIFLAILGIPILLAVTGYDIHVIAAKLKQLITLIRHQ